MSLLNLYNVNVICTFRININHPSCIFWVCTISKLIHFTVKLNLTGGAYKLGGLPAHRTYHVHPNMVAALCAALHDAGAKKGRILKYGATPKADEILLQAETSWMGLVNPKESWPSYLFSAAIKKHHPYAELIHRLNQASRI